jgi:hypothetical protein
MEKLKKTVKITISGGIFLKDILKTPILWCSISIIYHKNGTLLNGSTNQCQATGTGLLQYGKIWLLKARSAIKKRRGIKTSSLAFLAFLYLNF